MTATTSFHTCPLCEATCGLELNIEDGEITRVRGDRDHVFSRGFICPKGAAFGKLVHDPDRLRRPLVRDGDTHREVGWDEAFAVVEERWSAVVARHGAASVAAYVGNPNAHTMSGGQYLRPFLRSLGTTNVFSASTVDQMPKHVACGFLYGDPLAIAVPDIDRTDMIVLLGANPYESNGSLCTAPDFPGRLEAVQGRGGRVVVVDPRRTRTAAMADDHIPIRPGADAFLLFALVHVLFADGLVDLGRLADHVVGLDDVERLAKDFPPEAVAARTGITAGRIRALARELADAPTAVVYGRVGTCTVEFGTLASWLVDVVNALTGNLDSPGGAMFPLAPHLRRRTPAPGRGFVTGRVASRVRGAPEVLGELPVAVLAEEIDTPGAGQIRAIVTVAGNPVLSTPNSERLDRALASLELMVSVDPYLNETTRHADVILPPTDSARVGHYDFSFLALAIRNTAVYSRPALPPDPGGMDECDILARLTSITTGRGADADIDGAHDAMLTGLIAKATGDGESVIHGRDPAEIAEMVEGLTPSERLLDVTIRTGAYGDGFGVDPDGLTLATLVDNPHGIDLGPLQPRVPEIVKTTSGKIELCPEPIAADVERLRGALDTPAPELVLVGRRDVRSNNSWMHNVEVLVKGKPRCTLHVHPDDAERLGLADGAPARVESRVGAVVVDVQVTPDVMAGVVSLPHGWGHDRPGTRMRVAAGRPGVNSNILTDEAAIDPLSGNAVLNAIPVTVSPS
ncbi:MAG: molybdopterin-binding oxidoreductase [Acidimicrobiales bacterium]|nr:molybdopterin-binding oxidoreductase [Acidimicrobiales bacterium]